MAFSNLTFKPLSAQQAQTGSPSLYSYTTTDALADVNTAGYFNDLSTELSPNDLIYGVTSTGTTAVHAWYVVLTNAAGVVDVADGVVIAVTDTD